MIDVNSEAASPVCLYPDIGVELILDSTFRNIVEEGFDDWSPFFRRLFSLLS
jgi:hypothetical protein